ncbi:MAG: CoA transferase [Gammaproteobacteria bacterium]
MPGFLAPYRVLDLTDERGLLAGHMFAQLGADVLQVEPPGGSPARAIGPFAPDAPTSSLFWSAYAAGKRGMVLDASADSGRALLRRLIERADFLIESADRPQRLAWDLEPARTLEVNPALVHVTVSAFGIDGPKAGYAATDLTVWAAGGPLLPSRDGTRPPVRITVPQAWSNAAADAAGGALIAHFARVDSGLGQHVDVSAQQSAALCTLGQSLAAPFGHAGFSITAAASVEAKKGRKKELDLSGSGARTRRSKWQVRDGLVEMHIGIGPASGRFSNNLFRWMHAEGACEDDIAAWDWIALPQRILSEEIGEDDLDRARDAVARFFARFTKEELLLKSMEHRFLCAPIATTRDLLDSRQLRARGYFQTVVEPSGAQRTLPGNFAAGVVDGFVPLAPAPAPGQHTDAVLREWLGETDAGIATLRAAGAVA